jgi:hypothetical protein
MQPFDPRAYGAADAVIDIERPVIRRIKAPEIVSDERQPDQWQPIGSVIRRIVERMLLERPGDANG